MVKTQVQIPDELFARAKALAAAKEWSFAELVRRGLENMTQRHPAASADDESGDWQLPLPVNLGLTADPFADDDWREEAGLGTSAAHLIAARLREDAARYDAGE